MQFLKHILQLFIYSFLCLHENQLCTPGGGYRQYRSRDIRGDRLPELANEKSTIASGSSTPLDAGDKSLVQVISTDIIFADPKFEAEARLAIQACADSLTTLGVITKSQWRGKALLYVKEGYLSAPKNKHSKDSLHYGGRAFDVTLIRPFNRTSTSSKKKFQKFKYPHLMLRTLAWLAFHEAGFSYVRIYKNHLHLSCRKKTKSMSSSRCFHGDSFVRSIDNTKRRVKDVEVGDKLLTINSSGKLIYSEVIMILHQNKDLRVNDYLKIRTQDNNIVTMSSYHLIFTSGQQVKFSKNIKIGEKIFTYNSHTHVLNESVVASITKVRPLRGAFAPLTMEGTIIVDDIYASCYALFPSHAVSHVVFWLWRIAYPCLQYFNIEARYDGEYHWYTEIFRKSINYLHIFPYTF